MGEARFLPLSFYDGKNETNIGQVRIHSSLDYKAFQSILSEKIGISSNQMSIYFVDRNSNQKPMNQRRILITGKASFNLILQGKDCTVLVVLKRSRRDRRQKSKLGSFARPGYYLNVNNLAHQPNTFNLLGRSVPVFLACPVLPYYDQIAVQQFLNNNNRFRNNSYNYPTLEEPEPKIVGKRCNFSYCDECMNARSQGKAAQFHLCVNDAVTVSFRSPAGPIARPSGCFV